ncbi:sensor histidine kinase [Roseomonas sp. 18066]|uniref:sensor histidine kinase n=1 Tax=Roseomonas sp. 18066 TaxID=2681412 RepID=UPI00135A8372|nr:PAS domain-containing sensor histidine kinase [Roseomonas sp. 18066]
MPRRAWLAGWPLAWLALALLTATFALLAYRLAGSEATIQEVRALEDGLKAEAKLSGHPLRADAAALAPALAVLDRLAADYPELAAPQALLRLRLAAGLAAGESEAAHRALHVAAHALEDALMRRIAILRQQDLARQRNGLLGALASAAAGAGLLVLALRQARREARAQAGNAAQARAQIRALAEAAPLGMALLDAGLTIAAGNARFAQLAGASEAALPGQSLAQALPWLHAAIGAELRAVLVRGGGLPGQAVTAAGPDGADRHYHLAIELLETPPDQAPDLAEGAPHLCLIIMDVTERATMEAWRDELVGELNHRVKNTLATVQSLAAQTLRGAALDPQRFAADFSARLGALSRSHELLAAVGWSQATLSAVVQAALGPWQGGGRLRVEGPEGPLLRPGQAQALVIALSELASNATHHGALGGEGHVSLRWDCLPDGALRLAWREYGGPRLAGRPLRQGFGMRFLERGLAYDLGPGTQVRLNFDTDGLYCEVRFRSLEPRHCLTVRAA